MSFRLVLLSQVEEESFKTDKFLQMNENVLEAKLKKKRFMKNKSCMFQKTRKLVF